MHRKTGKHHVLDHVERKTITYWVPEFQAETRWGSVKRWFKDYFGFGVTA